MSPPSLQNVRPRSRRLRSRSSQTPAFLGTALILVLVAIFIGGCGGQTGRSRGTHATAESRTQAGTGSGRQQSSSGASVAYDLTAYLFPRSGADWAIGRQLMSFEMAQVYKAETACMVADGLPDPPTGFAVPEQYGSAFLPNLPVIERTLSIGVTQAVAGPHNPAQGMSASQAAAYQAALKRCSARLRKPLAFLSSSNTVALQTEWLNVVNTVIASAPVAKLNQQATQCAARTSFPANSVENEVGEIGGKVTPLILNNESVGARSTEIAGSRVLIRCFGPEINVTDGLLAKRRLAFFTDNAQAIDQIESAMDRTVASLGAPGSYSAP